MRRHVLHIIAAYYLEHRATQHVINDLVKMTIKVTRYVLSNTTIASSIDVQRAHDKIKQGNGSVRELDKAWDNVYKEAKELLTDLYKLLSVEHKRGKLSSENMKLLTSSIEGEIYSFVSAKIKR